METVSTEWIRWIIFVPLLGAVANALFGRRLQARRERLVGLLASAAAGVSFGISVAAFFKLLSLDPGSGRVLHDFLYRWIDSGDFSADVSFIVDPLSAVMVLVVSGVGFLIHVYSIGYMHGDSGGWRYFSYLNLFLFSMLLLVLADNILLLFVGWEGVGLCSYLLIGFWFEDRAKASAGMKAFVVNRIGDFGFLLGIILLFWSFSSHGVEGINFYDIRDHADVLIGDKFLGAPVLTVIALLLFLGAVGKSAQIPLYVWLPDAMAGPTPVSALIHAATMVTAGIYMVCRLAGLYMIAPGALEVVAWVGGITAIYAAVIGLAQTDIKKVLAYSTVSQLGYMFLGCGVGAFGAGIFHLTTHAYFKALLFLGAGSVIHGLSQEQDIRKMGGLRKRMPVTWATFIVATLAIAGIPPLSGFFSKDEILWAVWLHGNPFLYAMGLAGALLTAFYMFRLVHLVFHGHPRTEGEVLEKAHESPPVMTAPLVILALLAVAGGWVGISHALGSAAGLHVPNWIHGFLSPVFGETAGGEAHAAVEVSAERMAAAISVLAALIGIGAASVLYLKLDTLRAAMNRARAGRAVIGIVSNKFYIDEIYDFLIIRPVVWVSDRLLWRFFDDGVIDGVGVNGAARSVETIARRVLQRAQSGVVQNYAFAMVLGLIALVGYIVFG